MNSMIRFHVPRLASALLLGALSTTFSMPAGAQGAMGADAVKGINTECDAIQNAVMALKPVHLAMISSTWKVLSDADYTVAERTHASATFADVWKQGKNYAWVHSHTFDAKGNQRATQLCFRQSDGTLERARQATTVDGLSAASAQTAFFSPDGSVIQQTAAFVVNDPAVAKKVQDLPYYSQLP